MPSTADRTYGDLANAADFFDNVEHRERFPIGEYAEPADIMYIIEDGADAKIEFETIAQSVAAFGGSVLHRPHEDTMQHVAIMPFGSGRVRYRLLWIEHGVTTTIDEGNSDA
jgi:hypothetical protein